MERLPPSFLNNINSSIKSPPYQHFYESTAILHSLMGSNCGSPYISVNYTQIKKIRSSKKMYAILLQFHAREDVANSLSLFNSPFSIGKAETVKS